MTSLDDDLEPTRAELIERLIAATSRANLAERTLRDYTAHQQDNPGASYLQALHARITQLEQNIDKLVEQRRGKQTKQAA